MLSWSYLSATPPPPMTRSRELVEYVDHFKPSDLFQTVLDKPDSGFHDCQRLKTDRALKQLGLKDELEEYTNLPNYLALMIGLETHTQLLRILELLDGDVRGKAILNLGCGSRSGTEEARSFNDGARFFPWLSRILHQLKARSIGIDIGDLNDEVFEGRTIDLLQDDSLAEIPDESIDLVNCYR